MAALLGGKLLLQSGLAVIQQQILVVLEIPLAAVLGEEPVGGGVHRKFGDEHHHLLTFRKGLLHKVESGFQRSSGGLLGGLALVRQRTELTAQQVEGLLRTGGIGAATALREAGMEGQVKILSMDTDQETLRLIKDGVIDATLAQNTQLMSYYGVQILYSVNNASEAMGYTDAMGISVSYTHLTLPTNSLV